MSFDPGQAVSEVRPYLETALTELNLGVSSGPDEVLREYARALAEELLAGGRPVEAALEEMHRAVVSPLKHPEDLMGWCYLWEGLAPDGSFDAVTGRDLERATRAFAAQWLAAPPSPKRCPP
jgi:heme oxygenase